MTASGAHSARSRRDARDSHFFSLIVVGLSTLALCPAALATGGVYAGDAFYAAGQDPCEANGSTTVSVGPPTTGIADGRWFDEYTHSCADGTTVLVRVDRGAAPPMPGEEEAGYEPTPSDPAPPCVEAHYTDDPDSPWDEGTC